MFYFIVVFDGCVRSVEHAALSEARAPPQEKDARLESG